jgi:hypothetical protein
MMRRATDTEETSEHVSPVSPSNTTSTGPGRRYWPAVKKDTNGARPAVGGLRPWAEPGIG